MKTSKLSFFGKIAGVLGCGKKAVVSTHAVIYGATVEELRKGNQIVLGDFGSMLLKNRAARTGRNPMTGQSIAIPAKKVVRFRPAKQFRQDLGIISKPIKPASSGKGGR